MKLLNSFILLFCVSLIYAQDSTTVKKLEHLDSLVAVYYYKGDYETALNYAQEVTELSRVYGEYSTEYASSINDVAVLYRMLGQFEAAEPLNLQAVAIRKKLHGEKDPNYAKAISNLAGLYYDMGRYEESETYYLQAIAIRKDTLGELHPVYGKTLNNLGVLYRNTGEYSKGEPLFIQAAYIYKNYYGENSKEYAMSLANLAALQIFTQHHNASEENYLEALRIYKKELGERHPHYASAQNNLASLYIRQRRFDEAEKLYLNSLEVQGTVLGEHHPRYFLILSNLGNLYRDKGDYENAEQYFLKALQANAFNQPAISLQQLCINPKKVDFVLTSDVVQLLMDWGLMYKLRYQKGGNKEDLQKQQSLLQAAIDIHHHSVNNLNYEQDQLRLLQGMHPLLGMALQNIEQLMELVPAQRESLLAQAFQHAEQNKSALLSLALQGQRAQQFGDLPDSLIQRQLALQQKTAQLKASLPAVQRVEDKEQLMQAHNDLQVEINQFQQLIKNNYPKYHQLKYENITASSKEIQKVLKENQVLIEYHIQDTVFYTFLVSKEDIQLFTTSYDPSKLKELIRNLRQGLTNYGLIEENIEFTYKTFHQSSYALFQLLMEKPFATLPKSVDQLIIIPDEELGYIPFGVLLSAPAPKELAFKSLDYLLKKYSISYNYSSTLLKEAMQAPQPENNNSLLAISGKYDGKVPAQTRSPYQATLRKQLQSLPEAEEEVRQLGLQFEGAIWHENQANEAAFKTEAKAYAVLHLALHGIFDAKTPILSSLVFSENGDSLEDNFLQAYEISQMQLNADLVVLSACETGYGKFQQGEGVMSLARSFMYAGANSLVVSLWEVHDASTSWIIQRFYKNLAKGMDKSVALQKAKLAFLEQAEGSAAHPAYWAPFIQLGDARPIELKRKQQTFWHWYLIAGLGGTLFLLVGMRFAAKRQG